MSSFNDNPYSYTPGTNRLLQPVSLASSASYDLQASSGLAQDAVQMTKGQYFYKLNSSPTSGTAPSSPPSVPQVATAPLSTSITMYFNIAGVTGTPTPQYIFLYGTTANPTTPFLATRASPSLALYVGTFTGLNPSTTYYFKSVATNENGSKVSAVSAGVTTSNGSGVAPSGPPSVPVVSGTPTSSSITITFDVAGITGTPTPTYSALIGTGPNPAGPLTATLVSGTTYQAVATGLQPSTPYFFKSVASNGVSPNAVSTISLPIRTANPTPSGPLKTNLVLPFLIQGPRFNTPYTTALDYYINVDAVGATLSVGATAPSGNQVYGSMYGGTIGSPSQAGTCTSDVPYSPTYGAITDAYLQPLQTSGNRLLVCLGGFYADILGLFGPYQPAGFPGTNPSGDQVIQSFLYNFCGITAGNTNPLNWSRAGYTTYFDGLVLDFENVGYGGNPNVSNQYPLAQSPAPSFPADATNPKYAPYISVLSHLVSTYYALAPSLFLGNAPVSLSINGDALGGARNGNISSANTALNTWFAFTSSSVVPSDATYNDVASYALNHPEQLSFMDDIFVQFYNEDAIHYLGGAEFPNLLAQWGFVALKAQAKGRKKTTINIGLAKGNIIPGGSPAVASAQGPTFNLPSPPNASGSPPYTYFAPQYATSSPPNYKGAGGWPNTGPIEDPASLASAISTANSILQNAFSNPSIQPRDWCSGAGFWAGGNATLMAKSVYTAGNPASPGAILPALQTYCWSDATYPSPDPLWPGNTPIVNTL